MPVDRGRGVNSMGQGYFVLSPVSLASRDQDGRPSNSTISIYSMLYNLTEKQRTVKSLSINLKKRKQFSNQAAFEKLEF